MAEQCTVPFERERDSESVPVAIYTDDAMLIPALAEAEAAMYEAKGDYQVMQAY
jgi:hypothetical protein